MYYLDGMTNSNFKTAGEMAECLRDLSGWNAAEDTMFPGHVEREWEGVQVLRRCSSFVFRKHSTMVYVFEGAKIAVVRAVMDRSKVAEVLAWERTGVIPSWFSAHKPFEWLHNG